MATSARPLLPSVSSSIAYHCLYVVLHPGYGNSSYQKVECFHSFCRYFRPSSNLKSAFCTNISVDPKPLWCLCGFSGILCSLHICFSYHAISPVCRICYIGCSPLSASWLVTGAHSRICYGNGKPVNAKGNTSEGRPPQETRTYRKTISKAAIVLSVGGGPLFLSPLNDFACGRGHKVEFRVCHYLSGRVAGGRGSREAPKW